MINCVHALVGDTGLEPVTSSVSRKRATRLRQSPVLRRAAVMCIVPARRERESNPRTGLCRPLPKPLGHPAAGPGPHWTPFGAAERTTGFEPATLTLAR